MLVYTSVEGKKGPGRRSNARVGVKANNEHRKHARGGFEEERESENLSEFDKEDAPWVGEYERGRITRRHVAGSLARGGKADPKGVWHHQTSEPRILLGSGEIYGAQWRARLLLPPL